MKINNKRKSPILIKIRDFSTKPRLTVLGAFLAVGILGAVLITVSHADTFSKGVEAEDGQIAGNAKKVADTAASGGNKVTFSSGTGGGGTGGGTGDNDPTAATCPSPTPVAPVTGYKIKACEDFNNGLGDFDAYNGGGEGTVVGGGRKSGQCTSGGGILTLTQNFDGSTCGGSMNNHNGRYGYWEVKMRAYSTGSGGSAPHPVLILWPDSGNWSDGELDYFETNIGDGIGGYFHCTDGSGIDRNCFTLPDKDVDYTKFHVYSIEWTASGANGWIDGESWYTTTSSNWQPKTSSHQTIQLDNLSGRTPVSPGKMEVDWVHTYSK